MLAIGRRIFRQIENEVTLQTEGGHLKHHFRHGTPIGHFVDDHDSHGLSLAERTRLAACSCTTVVRQADHLMTGIRSLAACAGDGPFNILAVAGSRLGPTAYFGVGRSRNDAKLFR